MLETPWVDTLLKVKEDRPWKVTETQPGKDGRFPVPPFFKGKTRGKKPAGGVDQKSPSPILELQNLMILLSTAHRIHVWYIYLHLVDFYGKYR